MNLSWYTRLALHSRSISSAALARLFTLAACLFMILGAYCLRWISGSEALLPLGCVFALAGGLALLAGLALYRTPVGSYQPAADVKPTAPSYVLLLPGLFALALLIVANTLNSPDFERPSLGTQFALLVVAVVWITLGMGGIRLRWNAVREAAKPAQRSEALLLAAIVFLAFVLRAWNLELAVHKFIDELHFAAAITTLKMTDQHLALLAPFSSITAFPWLYPYMQSWFADLGGHTLAALRWVSVIFGTLGIPALYLLAKTLFDRKTAFIAALLLATFPPHIQFSRIGLNNIADPLFGTLAVAFLARGLKQGRRLDFALGGAALGLTQYFYEGGRFLFPILIVGWLLWHILISRFVRGRVKSPSRPELITHPSLLVTFSLTALLIGMPVYLTLLALNRPFDERFQTTGIGGSYWFKVQQNGSLQTLGQQLLRPILIYLHLPETGLYYGGEQGLLLPYLVVFFLLGSVWLLWRWRALSSILLPWVALASLGSMLLTDGAISARFVVTFPALMLITAVGMRCVPPLIGSKQNGAGIGKYLAAGVYFLVVVFAAAQTLYYFGPHLQTYNRQIRPSYDSEDALFRAASLPGPTLVQIISDSTSTESYLGGLMGYLGEYKVVKVLPPASVSETYLKTLPRSLHLAFFIQPKDGVTLSMLRRTFDLQGPFSSPYDVAPAKQLLLFYVKDNLPG
jgi:dolichyl-phosphate-mannose-protein mannosyltransferase